jgi:hypothetical protein
MSKPPRAKYRTTNWTAYSAALKGRGSLMVWLDADVQWKAPSSGRAGRPTVFSDAAIHFCLTLKCMFGLGLRPATGLAESVLKFAQLDWNVPDYSTLSRRQKTLSVAITARPSRGGLHLLVDSTGVKMLGEGEWRILKHCADYQRQCRKVHLGVDLGCVHSLSHSLGGVDPRLHHGTLNALFLPAVIRFNAGAKSVRKDRRLERMARAMNLDAAGADDLGDAIRDLAARLGLPSGLA